MFPAFFCSLHGLSKPCHGCNISLSTGAMATHDSGDVEEVRAVCSELVKLQPRFAKVEILAVKLTKRSVKKERVEAGCWQLYMQHNPMSTAGLRTLCTSRGSD